MIFLKYFYSCLMASIIFASIAHASDLTWVGNGDDGTDLEGLTPITQGKIERARRKAITHLTQLNTQGIPGLGTLVPELSNSKIYLAQKDVGALNPQSQDHGKFHSSLTGQVYARTFAQPHSPVRFFPIALELSEKQLVALHIHEALHRALPPSVRQNEATVSQITLALTEPQANFDNIAAVTRELLPQENTPTPQKETLANSSVTPPPPLASVESNRTLPPPERFQNPSFISYSYKEFLKPKGRSQYPVTQMHVVQSYLYPFGNLRTPLGFGIEASLLKTPYETQSGPLSLAANVQAWSNQGFDFSFWGKGTFNSLSDEELKNSPFGRDLLSFGTQVRKENKVFYLENQVGYTLDGETEQKIGNLKYKYEYGSILYTNIRVGAVIWKLRPGVYGEFFLADNYKIKGGAFEFEKGRYRILGGGPELFWIEKEFTVGLQGRMLINATKNANYDHLGNLMGAGAAQGGVSASVSIYL